MSVSQRNEDGYKQAAKVAAKISENAIFWAFHRRDLYYTGVSNLLSQLEFTHDNLIYDIYLEELGVMVIL